MLTVYHSNHLSALKTVLKTLIEMTPLDNPLEPENILIQSTGMAQWLKLELAKDMGVAANLQFHLPASFIWDQFVSVLPNIPKKSAFNKEAMTWKIMHLLPQFLPQESFATLNNYLGEEYEQAKLHQLCEKIADIFDGYLVYRPDWIAAWEQGESIDTQINAIQINGIQIEEADREEEKSLEEHQPWQPILWRALYQHTDALNQPLYHRANLYDSFLEAIASLTPEQAKAALPKRLFIIGISSLPPKYLEALKAIGEFTDVHLLLSNPCRFYWGDIKDRRYLARMAAQRRHRLIIQERELAQLGESPLLKGNVEDNEKDELDDGAVGNALLSSLGKQGRDNLALISDLEADEMDLFIDIERDSLLHHIQADILDLTDPTQQKRSTDISSKTQLSHQDHSLSLHACHSALREVEVLHDNLLAMLDRDPSLSPKDIIVMVSDISAYSPLIQAVFGNAPRERYIPYSVSDMSVAQEMPLLTAFMTLLSLPVTRYQASDLVALLETPAVLRQFDLSLSEFDKAKRWIEENHIRWGLNEHTFVANDLPITQQNTWETGAERLIAGYAMTADQRGMQGGVLFENPYMDIAPYNEVQGSDSELAGKLAQFIERLGYYQQRFSHDNTIDYWVDTLCDLMDDFFLVELNEEIVFNQIREQLNTLKETIQDSGYVTTSDKDQGSSIDINSTKTDSITTDSTKTPISLQIVFQYLQNHINSTRVDQRFLAGQVNFCTLMPMRSIPFKQVCLLGMNEGVFPRHVPRLGFDLMSMDTRRGDRSRRDDDRYLFLEAVLSAQDSLYISYIGRSIQDNTPKSPSILVSELLEYCDEHYEMTVDGANDLIEVSKALNHNYPMFAFNPALFTGDDATSSFALSSFAAEWLPAAERIHQGVHSSPIAITDTDILTPTDRVKVGLELEELQRFWQLPVKYLFTQRLKVNFAKQNDELLDHEPFALDGLGGYQVRNEILNLLLSQKSTLDAVAREKVIEGYVRIKSAQGMLPVENFGRYDLAGIISQSFALYDAVTPLIQSPLPPLEVNLAMVIPGMEETVPLQGWLSGYYQEGLVRYRTGRIRSQDMLAAWIDHLCLHCMGIEKATHIIGFERKAGVQHIYFPALPSVSALNSTSTFASVATSTSTEKGQGGVINAQEALSELVQYYYQGLNQPLPYFPECAKTMVETCIDKTGQWSVDVDKVSAAMEKRFIGGFQQEGEGENAYISRIWPQWHSGLSEELFRLSETVLKSPYLHIKPFNNG
ncbi:exodeoxyribonuclease V subunit gamma [Vibrio sp.]|nr:exodeoxyribonuclease V subunit gamma [Vibrio sp.]